MKRKVCHCGKASVPGLRPGTALCQYHFNAHMWGKKWADRCTARLTAKEGAQ